MTSQWADKNLAFSKAFVKRHGYFPLPGSPSISLHILKNTKKKLPAGAGVETHSGQGEEGDSQQGETCRQHPARPRLGRLVSVADGGQSDLRKQAS